MTENKLSENMNLYYDGLMGVDTKTTEQNRPVKTQSYFSKTPDGFEGKLIVYDAFFAKKTMILYVKVKDSYCPDTNKQLILFELSPKSFNEKVWDIFDDVKTKCD